MKTTRVRLTAHKVNMVCHIVKQWHCRRLIQRMNVEMIDIL